MEKIKQALIQKLAYVISDQRYPSPAEIQVYALLLEVILKYEKENPAKESIIEEYDKLFKENIALRGRIIGLEDLQSLDRDTINERNKTIKVLEEKLVKKDAPREFYLHLNESGKVVGVGVHEFPRLACETETIEIIKVREII